MNQAYQLTPTGDVMLLTVRNLLSEYTNRDILRHAQSSIDAGFAHFVVDLGGMPYTNSVGLNFLISLQARCQERDGQLVVANVSDKILQLLDITKLQPLFQLTDSVEAALRLVQQD
jgi:anti-sigma B factor antagonist